jgi:limonene-1,2-epoxide hydrolase
MVDMLSRCVADGSGNPPIKSPDRSRLLMQMPPGCAHRSNNSDTEVLAVTDLAESVVRNFMATWPRSDVDELMGFFTEDAVYTDGPRGTYRGIDAIKAELQSMVQMVPSTTADIKNLVVSGGIVMVERVDIFEMQGKSFDVEISGAFEVNGDGQITRWRDYYDMRSLEDRVAAALAPSG